jgi:nucleoside-diphosphate-sugar epimerase
MAFSRFIDMVLAGRPVPRYGDGEQVRDFTFVDDVVRATLLAARQPVVPGSVCNVAGGSAASVNDIIALLGELTGRDVAVEPLPSRAGDVVRTGAAVERARAWLGWEPLVECRDGVRRQLEWTAAQRVGR